MNIPDLPVEYFKILAEQAVFISAFLGGISATILVTFIITNNDKKVFKYMMLFAAIAAVSFIVAIFGMTKIQLLLAPDSPYEHIKAQLVFPRVVGGLSFYSGINSLLVVISLSGWLRSKRLGIITTILGVIAIVLTFSLT
ncbi:hypothetical protein [Kordia jejudonensis]|uniref:hypothetical protein n=1 Tax=Kordia jejudonensis TaxID=1348245 RepID=UPI0006294C0F|nr:hypothetical protein [Kordia jejudonensis]